MTPSRLLRAALPLAVTFGVFWLISQRVDWADAFAHLHADSLELLVPALLAYGAASLCIDAVSLLRSGAGAGRGSFLAMARLKAATYPLGILHYALGAGGLVVLLRRRAGLSLADATGAVMLIAAFDLLALLGVAAVASAWLTSDAGLRAGILGLVLGGGPLGLWLLRSEAPLGPLEPVRRLGMLRGARELPAARLVELLALRAAFVAVFMALGGAALVSFGLHPSLGTLVVGFAQVALVAAIPIAVAGLGTSQAAFLFVFRDLAPADELLACSVALSAGMIAVRVALGALCAREFARPPLPLEGERT